MKNVRSIKTVKAEISELQSLIQGKREVVAKYPDRALLKHSLTQYESRMSELQQELSEAKRLRS